MQGLFGSVLTQPNPGKQFKGIVQGLAIISPLSKVMIAFATPEKRFGSSRGLRLTDDIFLVNNYLIFLVIKKLEFLVSLKLRDKGGRFLKKTSF